MLVARRFLTWGGLLVLLAGGTAWAAPASSLDMAPRFVTLSNVHESDTQTDATAPTGDLRLFTQRRRPIDFVNPWDPSGTSFAQRSVHDGSQPFHRERTVDRSNPWGSGEIAAVTP